MSERKILILEPDKISQQLLSTFFIGEEFFIFDNCNDALGILEIFCPELILVNSQLLGLNGFNTIHAIHTRTDTNIPIIFLTDSPSLEEQKHAYGLGAFDYISRPYDINHFKTKIDSAIETHRHVGTLTQNISELKGELDVSYDSVLNTQNNLALMQYIIEFLQNSLFCHDYHSLLTLFFDTTQKFGSSCILKIEAGNQTILHTDSHIVHELEKTIINTPIDKKVSLFGKNRALFVWPSVRLLVRNIEDNSDYFSYLLNGVQATINAIQTENELLDSVEQLQAKNLNSQDKVSSSFNKMNNELKDIFLSLGLVSSLDPDEEERLQDCVDYYCEDITNLLDDMNENNRLMKDKINKLKLSTPDQLIDNTKQNDIKFF